MSKRVLNFNQFNNINEGGAAIPSSRRIREDEFEPTLESIKQKLFPILGIDPGNLQNQLMSIGVIERRRIQMIHPVILI